jgi:nucleotide-binding universal stress UspA family protein
MSEADGVGPARVVVGTSDSLSSRTALYRAAEEARRRGAELWAVLAWDTPGGELTAHRPAGTEPLLDEWRRPARRALLTVLHETFGTAGPGVPMRAVLGRGPAGRTLVHIADRAGDLLVVGAGRRGRLRRLLSPSVSRYCIAHAACPVLAVPPSPLAADWKAAHRRNALRLPLDTRHLTDETQAKVPPER